MFGKIAAIIGTAAKRRAFFPSLAVEIVEIVMVYDSFARHLGVRPILPLSFREKVGVRVRS
jgi:hypothetical protein